MQLPVFTPASANELAIFDYDASETLAVIITYAQRDGDITVYDLTYASPGGGDVTASLIVPHGNGPFPALIKQHGLGIKNGRVTGRTQQLLLGVDIARTGAIVLLIDAPFARPENAVREIGPITITELDRTEQIQYMVDLRRGVDLLQNRDDVDPSRIAYQGRSYSGAQGALLAGIEPRLKTCILTVADGGIVTHVLNGPPEMLDEIPQDQLTAWVDAMTPVEPIRFISLAKMPIFFQSALQDQAVNIVDAEAIHQAAPQPKTIKWYDSRHGLTEAQLRDQIDWLAEHIGLNAARFEILHSRSRDSSFYRPGAWHFQME